MGLEKGVKANVLWTFGSPRERSHQWYQKIENIQKSIKKWLIFFSKANLERIKIMKDIIDLDNNYYLKVVNENNEIPFGAISIENLKLIKVLKKEKIIFQIDFNKFGIKEYKKILRKLLFVKNIAMKMKRKLGIDEDKKKIVAYIINFNENDVSQQDFISSINAIFYNTRYERYNYIYDTVCNYLDSYFYGKNLCDFQNNKCGEKRNSSSTTGCCHHFKHKALGPLSKLVLCEYLNKENYTCDAKCLSCKLFTCDYLESKGIKFKIKDILLLDTFFNPLQKYFIKYMVFTPKEKILKRLMKL